MSNTGIQTDTQDVQTALGPANQGCQATDQFVQSVQQAATGGQATADYFQSLTIVNNFYGYLQSGDVWIADTDDNGNPVYFAIQEGGTQEGALQASSITSYKELKSRVQARGTTSATVASDSASAATTPNYLYMVLATNPYANVQNGNIAPGQFPWNGKGYNIVGSITGTLSYNEQPLWYVDLPLGIIDGIPIAALFTKVAWPQFVKPLLTGAWNGIKSAYQKIFGASDMADVEAAVDSGVESAAVDSADVGGEVAVSMTVAGGLAFSAIVVLAAIPIILSILAHPSSHAVKLYNLTPYDITWNLAYLDEGAMNAAPVIAQGSSTYNTKIPAMHNIAPPGLNPVMAASEADFSFNSASEYHGLGYAMSYVVTDPNNNNNQITTGAAAFFIPWAGDNSLYATLDPTVTNYEQFYIDYVEQGQNQETQMVVTGTGAASNLTLTITYDYLSGKHPGPSGQNAYTYSSMVVFSVAS